MRCGNGTDAFPSTESSPGSSSTTPPASERSTHSRCSSGPLVRDDRRSHRQRCDRTRAVEPPCDGSCPDERGGRRGRARRRDVDRRGDDLPRHDARARRTRSRCCAFKRRCSPPAASDTTSRANSRDGRPSLRRYLAVEGHRVLAADDDVLPTLVLRLVDHDLAGRVTSPEDSFVLARSRSAHRRRASGRSARSIPDGYSRPGSVRNPHRRSTATSLATARTQ